jgi:glycosyltransferase involved in cell wall biosynthesis
VISGEPTTPGHHYRVLHTIQLAEAAGWRADWSEVAPVGPHTLAGARVVVLWRVGWSPHVQGIIDACDEIGAHVLFDVDDLVFKPELARIDIIDGIRTTETTESAIGSFFAMVNRALDKCALTLVTTEELAQHVRSIGRVAVVLPNGFDETTRRRARLALRKRRAASDDGLVRIGYASGSRTHQRDFGPIAGALAAVLRARPETRLVLFRDPRGGEGVVLLHEFPELAALEPQIEWRDMVEWPDLPDELARFDINLAPLEANNVFCEAKSELKYFEAALAGAPTVSSPAGPMVRAIRDGETGFIAADAAAWETTLLRLVDDRALRDGIAQAAYHDVLWRFGPHRREEVLLAVLREFEGGAEGARAFELRLRRGDHLGPGLPHVPDAETRFETDALGDSEVTVIVPLYNYAAYVLEALESVATQTLDPIDLVVIDDASTDHGLDLVVEWARHHANRFNRLVVSRHVANAGLGFARNSGFAAAETPFVLPLDADNRLRPDCAADLLASLRGSRLAFAYPSQERFGDKGGSFGDSPYWPSRLVTGNYIDALGLVAKWAWAAAGGYDHVRHGWEDYDFWCRLAELGLGGMHVAAVLAEYRVHKASMLARSTDVQENKLALVADLRRRHPWLRIPPPG